MAPRFGELLEAMDMALDAKACPGLVRVDEETLRAKKRDDAPAEEIFAIERALHFGVDYVYFRRFVERPVMATVYLYDWTERLVDACDVEESGRGRLPRALLDELAQLQRRCWSAGEVPLVYVFLPTRVHIYHVLKGPKKGKRDIEPDPWQDIELAADVANRLKAFSARRLDDGRFWEEHPGARELGIEGAAFMALSREIANCRARLEEKHRVDPVLVKRLLIIFVLVKYLEERRGVFPEDLFSRFGIAASSADPEASPFVSLLRKGGDKVLDFLDHLAGKDRFNGDVFHLEDAERQKLCAADLGPFADLLDAKIENDQRTFWRRYAFNELPVELISHLYEDFIHDEPGVVYTPPDLVSFMLDEVLPLAEKTPKSFRLIDPACGSGVFLVGAYKRLVHRWRRQNHYKRPSVKVLKDILRDHVFGVDCAAEAIHLSMFSLSLALCDFLDPKVIWDELHFDRLRDRNLIEDDFFTQCREQGWNAQSGFDLIVGNPPFNLKQPNIVEAEIQKIRGERGEEDFELPDKHPALLFLKVATRIAKPGGRVALIVPSLPLLYGDKSIRFRKPLLESIHVPQIVDFTHLSRILFKRPKRPGVRKNHDEPNTKSNPGDVPVAAVFAEKCAPKGGPLLHVTVRRTVQAEQKLLFEIDHYDLHFVPREEALREPFTWKANFVGGGRIVHLIRRLTRAQSLGDFLEKATKERGWVKGEGYIVGKNEKAERLAALSEKESTGNLSEQESGELRKLRKRYRRGPWLTGRKVMPNEAFTSRGIDWTRLEDITQEIFAEPRQEELFSLPLLLIKDLVEAETGKVPVSLVEDREIRFLDGVLGIHAPKSDLRDLERIRDFVTNDRLLRFSILATSSAYLIGRSSALHTKDILEAPFPDSPDDLELNPIEEALVEDALEHVAEFKRKGEEAAVLGEPADEDLDRFGAFFCDVLGSVYRTLRRGKPVRTQGAICYPFYFGKKASEAWTPKGKQNLDALLEETVGTSLRCKRILRIFRGNMLLLVKPPQLRYWLRSIAIRDADEIFAELQKQGY